MAPGAKVQASKLSPVVTEAMIRKLFEHIGPLDNMVLIPSPLGAGYEAIIEFQEKDAALTATHLTGTLFGGRPLSITQMDITLPALPASGTTTGVRPFTNLTMQQQQAQQAINGSGSGVGVGGGGGVVPPGNPVIRMGATIHHPQQFSHPMGYPPVYPNPHMTLYNPNIMPPQYHQQQQLHQQRLMEQANDPSKADSKTVYVGNLPLTVTKEQLEETFLDCGTITRVNITGKATHPTRFAFMDFETLEGARKALASTDKVIGDRTLRVNPPKHSGPLPYMIQHAQMMQAPIMAQPPPSQTSAMDATRTRYKNILIGLINRGGDPSLLKKLEELEAGGPLPDMSGITGLSPDSAALNNNTTSKDSTTAVAATGASPSEQAAGPSPQTAASLLEKLVSSSRRRSRSPSGSRSGALSSSRRRSRSRSSMDRDNRDNRDDYYRRSGSSSRRSTTTTRRRSHSRSRSPSRSKYSRSSRAYDVDDRDRERERERERERYESSSSRRRERDEPSRSSRSSRGHAESSRPRDRDRERERERDRDRERHRD